MGRFYKTAVPEFVDNFIYQPPWELMMATLQKKEDGIKNQLNEMEFLKNLPIDYIDYDKDLALSEKEKISAQVDDIASNFQKDLLNPNNKHEIQKLKRELQKSTTNGTIYNLQKNAEIYRKFEAMRNALPDPNDREAYTKMFENYKNSNKELRDKGEFGQVFNPEEMYNSTNYWDMFTKSESFKALEPDMKKSKIDKINGAWVVTQGSETKSLEESKIGQAFRNFIQTQPSIKGYANSREKYFNEKWLDDKGEINFSQGALSNMLNEGVPSLAYSQTGNSKDLQMNLVWSQLNKQAFEASENAKNRAFQREQIEAQERIPKEDTTPEVGILANKLLSVSQGLQNEQNEILKPLLDKWYITSNGKKRQGSLQEIKNLILKGGKEKYGTMYSKIKKIEDEYNKNYTASKGVYTKLLGKTNADQLFNDIETKTTKNIPLYFGIGELGDVQSKPLPVERISTIGDTKIVKSSIIKGTAMPIPLGTRNGVKDDFVRVMVEFEDEKGKVFQRPMYKEMKYYTNQ